MLCIFQQLKELQKAEVEVEVAEVLNIFIHLHMEGMTLCRALHGKNGYFVGSSWAANRHILSVLVLFWKTQKNEKKNTKEIFNKKYAIIIVGSIPIWDVIKPVFKGL